MSCKPNPLLRQGTSSFTAEGWEKTFYPKGLQPREWFAKGDAVSTDFTYIRWLGDRKGIENLTKTWDKTVVDRTKDLEEWVEACRNFLKQKIRVFAFANNHYSLCRRRHKAYNAAFRIMPN